jgi:hypothetical protein
MLISSGQIRDFIEQNFSGENVDVDAILNRVLSGDFTDFQGNMTQYISNI